MGKRLWRFAAGVAMAIALLVSGCGGPSTETKISAGGAREISFLTMQLRPTFDAFLLPILKEFETAHPDVSLNWLDYPFQNYETKVVTSFLGGNAPDIINFASETIPSFTDAGHLLELDSLVPKDILDSYLPNVVEQGCRVKGKLYALPWYLAGAVSVYNKKILQEAGIDPNDIPRTYEDLPAFVRTIHDKTGKFGYFPLYTEAGSLRLYWIEAGVPVFDPATKKVLFNTPRGLEVLKFWTDLYRERLVPAEALTAMHRRPIELYKSGQLALFETGPQFLKQIKSDAPEVYADTLVGPNLTWRGVDLSPLVLQAVSISKKTAHPKQAVEFAEFITSGKNQLAFCKQTVILPSVKAALEDPYFTSPENTPEGQARMLSAEAAKNGILPPVPPNSVKFFKILDDVMEAVALGQISPEEGIAKAEKECNAVLAQP